MSTTIQVKPLATETICDNTTATEQTLSLLNITGDFRRVLRVERHPERPIQKLILCFRKCQSAPSFEIAQLVQALSCQQGQRSFSGAACHEGFYVGNNLWGKGFDKKSTYCQNCGYAMTGPEIDHVEIVESADSEWNAAMVKQCEFAGYDSDGEHYGLTWEIVKQ